MKPVSGLRFRSAQVARSVASRSTDGATIAENGGFWARPELPQRRCDVRSRGGRETRFARPLRDSYAHKYSLRFRSSEKADKSQAAFRSWCGCRGIARVVLDFGRQRTDELQTSATIVQN